MSKPENITPHQQREKLALELFEREKIVVSDGHFVYAAGGHGDAYVQKDKTLVDPEVFTTVTEFMAQDLEEEVDPADIDYLVGFAPCSSQYASRIAERLSASSDFSKVRTVFMEKVPTLVFDKAGEPYIDEKLRFKRGFGDLLIGKRVWMIEDIVTTGQSLLSGKSEIERIDGVEVLGASAAFSRTPELVNRASLGLNIWLPLIEKSLQNYPSGECPMDDDLERFPIRTDLGHGAAYLATHS